MKQSQLILAITALNLSSMQIKTHPNDRKPKSKSCPDLSKELAKESGKEFKGFGHGREFNLARSRGGRG
jgi:hypothetical protein